jgi:hypothetical protein
VKGKINKLSETSEREMDEKCATKKVISDEK